MREFRPKPPTPYAVFSLILLRRAVSSSFASEWQRPATSMTTPSSIQHEVTQLLGEWSGGDERALEKLVPLVEPELHRLAHYYMSRERAGHTLQTTALLNEAYLQLTAKTQPPWQNRTHFMAVAAQLMRRIMVDHARARHALK